MDNDRNIVFEVFRGGGFGPVTCYEIELKEDKYLFRYYHDYHGTRPNMKYINPIIKDNDYYNNFINNMKNITKDWESKYINKDIIDGEQWMISYLEDNIEYFGSNEYPSNFKDAFILLDNIFEIEKK